MTNHQWEPTPSPKGSVVTWHWRTMDMYPKDYLSAEDVHWGPTVLFRQPA